MKKKLAWILGSLLALLLVAYVVAEFFLGSIVKAGINRFGPSYTQTHVALQGAHFSPFSGSGELTGLVVGNPPGWSSDKAFSIGKIKVAVEPSPMFSDHVVVDEITIDGGEFVYETKIVASNIGDLLKNIEKADSSGAGAQVKAKNGQPMKFEVRKFRFTNGKATLGIGPTALTMPMPPISLDNLGTSEGGITSSQLALAVMQNLTASLAKSAAQAVGTSGGMLGGAATDALKGLFGKKK